MDFTEKKFISKTPLVEQLNSSHSSLLRRYQKKALGDYSFLNLIKYELTILLFGNTLGSLGYALRKWFYPKLFNEVGKGVIFGKGLVIRHPKLISLGNRVAIDDYVLLDAVGAGKKGMIIEDDVIISRNSVVQGKSGPVKIGSKTDLGCNTIICSANGIFIGHSVLIGANCYIGGGHYISTRLDITMMNQGVYSKGSVVIGDDVWLGAGVIVLDGVSIGNGCIVGAGAVVTRHLPDYAVAVGVPATVVKMRKNNFNDTC